MDWSGFVTEVQRRGSDRLRDLIAQAFKAGWSSRKIAALLIFAVS